MTRMRAQMLLAGLTLVTFGAGFLTGVGVERTGNNPVPAAVPGLGDKPKRGLVVQPGQPDCSLYQYGYRKDEGCPVAIGKGFRVEFHTVRDGWTIKGGVLTLVVANDNPGPIGAFWYTFHLNRYDGTLVEILSCKTPEFATGESRAITCTASDAQPIAPYDNVWIN